ncbi:CAP domain-containing protein [Desulfolucanica intricata]|uniref:CAP domain-containing protein n=1 Tax=Desulfolucanica intricata TaxID=1285191 RepID=UPI000ADC8177|nr:CAP domain-containing protein [Desulfolucanica intricata]
MRYILKTLTGFLVSSVVLMFALTVPVSGTAEAYTNYYTDNIPKYYNYYNYQAPDYNVPGQSAAKSGQPGNQSSGGINTSDEQTMLELVNNERKAAGLQPLASDPKLTQLARMKAQDMIDNNYFSHNSPIYGSPFDMMKSNGVSYRYAGENLAGASDVNTAHTNLMNSPGHKANILNPKYTKVGIGVVNGGPYGKMYVQEFNG